MKIQYKDGALRPPSPLPTSFGFPLLCIMFLRAACVVSAAPLCLCLLCSAASGHIPNLYSHSSTDEGAGCLQFAAIMGRNLSIYTCIYLFIYLTLGTEEEKKREKNTNLLFHLLTHPLVESCMCPDQGLNLQALCIGMML